MIRRHFLRDISGYLAAVAASCGACRTAFGMFPGQDNGQPKAGNSFFPDNRRLNPPAPQPREPEPEVSTSSGSFRMEGCTLSGNFNLGPGGFRFLSSSGDPRVDRLTFEEANILAGVTGLQPSLAFLDDGNVANAFAAKADVISGRSPHGAVALGRGIIRQMLQRTGDITAIGAVLVHEWAHIGQFVAGVRSRERTVAPTELMADFIAGWYHGYRCAHSCQQHDPSFAATGLASVGDYNTQDKGHHGTPKQRAAAYRDGYRFVAGGGGGGIYGFRQSEIQNLIAGYNNPYGGGGYGGGSGYGRARPPHFQEAFRHAARKYVG